MAQTTNGNSSNGSPLKGHKGIYIIIAIVVALAAAAGGLIAIKNFNTQQSADNTVLLDACKPGSTALRCSQARASSTKSTTKKVQAK